MSPREHIAAMKSELKAPSYEEQFWNNANKGQRKYLLHSAGHPRPRISEAAGKNFGQLDPAARNAAARGYRNLRKFAREMTGSKTMEVVEFL